MDMSHEIILPPSFDDPITREGMELGLKNKQRGERRGASDSITRRQLSIVRLKVESMKILQSVLSCDPQHPEVIHAYDDWEHVSPILTSQIFRDLMCINIMGRRMIRAMTEVKTAQLLQHCMQAYDYMEGYWPETSPVSMKEGPGVGLFTNVEFWMKFMDETPTELTQKKTVDLSRYYPEQAESVQNAFGLQDRPTDGDVKTLWKPLIVDALTIHLKSFKSCVISVPILGQVVDALAQVSNIGNDTGKNAQELNWLARLLAFDSLPELQVIFFYIKKMCS